jgi:hypothetical protein
MKLRRYAPNKITCSAMAEMVPPHDKGSGQLMGIAYLPHAALAIGPVTAPTFSASSLRFAAVVRYMFISPYFIDFILKRIRDIWSRFSLLVWQ